MKDLELTPYAPNLVESTRSIGYSFHTALADIIDNSVSNAAKRVDVRFNNGVKPYVAIIDDGNGMSTSTLEKAMRYGSSSSLEERNENDLGRFGLGLKMASLSQCRRLTVISKQFQDLSASSWDLDYIYKTEKWTLIRHSESQIKELPFADELLLRNTGTIVLWENLDRISETPSDFDKEFNEKLDFADKHMSLVFHRFLENERSKDYFELYFNNRKVEPIDPYFSSNPSSQQLETETLFIEKKIIKVTPFITPFASKLNQIEKRLIQEYKDLELKQGLYIYRNKRLIVWGKWFRISSDNELKRLAKIRIDLPNNIDEHWTIDVKKSSAQIPSMIKEQLKVIAERAAGKSERVYKYRGRRHTSDSYEHVWNKVINREKIQYLINKDLPTFKLLEKTLNDDQYKLLNSFIRTIEDAFPYASVYYDLAKEEKYEENTLEEEEIYYIVKSAIDSDNVNRNDIPALLKTYRDIDVFSKYPQVLDKIEEELLYD